ncbi:MAG TPA: hypothetical protein VIY08_14290, partial [Candidatus Nitrosocosmicus sp.]
FINKKFYKIKKSINIIIPVILGAIILIGNVISIPAYNLSIQKSFAQSNNTHNVFNPNFNSRVQNQNQNQVTAPIANSALHSDNGISSAALSVPFSGSKSNAAAFDPTFTYTKSATNAKTATSSHTHTRYHVVGPDNFKFINSYWTTSDTPRAVDVGTSANTTYLSASPHLPNFNLETDNAFGPTTLAVELQYEGVVQLIGITAALKLPSGFVSILPLVHDIHRYNFTFSNYRGHIYPGQGITLYFPMFIAGKVGVQKPYLAPLAIHFLREDKQFDTHTLSAAQQDKFVSSLSIKNGTSSSTYNSNATLNRNFAAIDEAVNPYDFVNQVLPIEFAVTGQEIPDVFIGAGPGAAVPVSPVLALLPPGVPTPIKILVRELGDAPIYNLNVAASVRIQSTMSATIVPSKLNIPSVVQQNAAVPLVLIGSQSKQVGFLPSNGTAELDITAVPSFFSGGTVEPIFITLTYNNALGQPTTFVFITGCEILPVSAQKALQNAIKIPLVVMESALNLPNAISNNALHILSNDVGMASVFGMHISLSDGRH